MKTLLIAWKLTFALVLSNCMLMAQAYPPKFVWGDGTDALEPAPSTEYQQNAIPQHVLNARWDQSSVWHKNSNGLEPSAIAKKKRVKKISSHVFFLESSTFMQRLQV